MKGIILFLVNTFLYSLTIYAQWQPVGDMGYGRYGHASASYFSSEGDFKLVVSGGFDGNSGLTEAELFNQTSETWDNLPDMNSARLNHTANAIGDQKVIFIGGWDGNATNWSTTEILTENLGSYEFTEGPEMATPRSYHRTAPHFVNFLLIVGGYDGFTNLASVERLNITTMEIEPMASMNIARSSFTITTTGQNNKFLVAGGFNPDYGFQMNQCEIYDAGNNTWTQAAPMNFARDNHAAIALPDGRVLVAGGRRFNPDLNLFEGIKECEIYDPVLDQWEIVGSTSGGHSYHRLFYFDDKIILPGGTDHSGLDVELTYSNTEFFDLATETWNDGGISVSGRYQYAGAVVNNDLVICGGEGANSVGGEIYYASTAVEEIQMNMVSVYPGVLSSGSHIQIFDRLNQIENISVFNAAGMLVGQFGKGIQRIPMEVSPGVYVLAVQSSNGIQTHKIIVN